MSTIDVRVPDLGDFKDVPVIEVLVKPGDRVKKNDALVTLESEKASMEVPTDVEGVVKSIGVKVGDKVNKGSVLVTLDSVIPSVGSAATAVRDRHNYRNARARSQSLDYAGAGCRRSRATAREPRERPSEDGDRSCEPRYPPLRS